MTYQFQKSVPIQPKTSENLQTNCQRVATTLPYPVAEVRIAKLAKFSKNLQNFANFWRARSRLYQNGILQENMRLKALVEIYTMHYFAQLQNHIFFEKY